MATTQIGHLNAMLPIHFFKIITKANIERVKIPYAFTRRYGDGLSNPVLMKLPDGCKWKVYWTNQNGEIWFEKGWKEFVQNYYLVQGHFVVFKYKGTCEIDVLILDHRALEINYPCSDTDYEEDKFDQSDDDSVKILENQKARPKSPLSSPYPKKMRNGTHGNVGKNFNLQILHVGSEGDKSEGGTKFPKIINHQLKGVMANRRTSSLNFPKSLRAQHVARNFDSNNPFFTLHIKRGHFKQTSKINVPKFIDTEKDNQNVMIQLGKRSWCVKLHRSSNGLYDRFSSGWSLFAKESKLQVGDICVFELIDPQVPLLKVYVY
ncbi:hypothetical protein VNO77_12012 [Canavalia gladiata]|uniref:TF-B3 domain-containing protein n=1 Tax=Canavalia gladiata TaxID=3824 RepID=A0AAN9LW91_CANGL